MIYFITFQYNIKECKQQQKCMRSNAIKCKNNE